MIKSFKIFESQILLIKSGVLKVKRYCSDLTENTDDLRGGTWFSDINDKKADRYNQTKHQLGGNKLFTGSIKYNKPYILTGTNTNYVLSDFQLFSYVNIYTEDDKNILFDVLDANNEKLIAIADSLKLFSNDVMEIIKKQSDFNIANIIAEKFLSIRLKENNFDIFIRLDEYNDIYEIFDINKLFVKNKN